MTYPCKCILIVPIKIPTALSFEYAATLKLSLGDGNQQDWSLNYFKAHILLYSYKSNIDLCLDNLEVWSFSHLFYQRKPTKLPLKGPEEMYFMSGGSIQLKW